MSAPANDNGVGVRLNLTTPPDPMLVDFVRALARRQARIDSTQAMGTAANDNQPRKSRAA
jgi:hypothetical protein